MLKIENVLQFKIKGIMNLDNAILVDNYTDEEVKKFAEDLKTRLGLPVSIYKYHGQEQGPHSIETLALLNLNEVQILSDVVLGADGIVIISNLHKYYKNKLIEILAKSNPSFLIWYMTYQIQFNPIMHLDKLENQFHIGPFSIEKESNLMTAYDKGMIEIERAVSKLAQNKTSTNGEDNDCGKSNVTGS